MRLSPTSVWKKHKNSASPISPSSGGDGGSAEKQRLLLAAFEAGALSAAEYGVAVARASKL